MATMRQIRSRIRVAKNIEQITKAMKMVAAARLKRAQDNVQAARPYAAKMRDVMGSLAGASAGAIEHPLLEQRPVRVTGILFLTGDRGLCGSYNTNVIRRAMELTDEHDPGTVKLYAIGNRGAQFLSRRDYPVERVIPLNTNHLTMADAVRVARVLRDEYVNGAVDELDVVYTRFVSAMTQHVEVTRLFPIEPPEGKSEATPVDYIYEPSPAVLLGEMLPRYVMTEVFQILLESTASEHGARMTSMTAATDNAGKMISSLTLALNRARQAGITKELAEITGGAEALKG